MTLLAFSKHTGVRIAEVGFLLLLLGGVWLAAAQTPQVALARGRGAIAGWLIAIAGVLLIIATHWGYFGV